MKCKEEKRWQMFNRKTEVRKKVDKLAQTVRHKLREAVNRDEPIAPVLRRVAALIPWCDSCGSNFLFHGCTHDKCGAPKELQYKELTNANPGNAVVDYVLHDEHAAAIAARDAVIRELVGAMPVDSLQVVAGDQYRMHYPDSTIKVNTITAWIVWNTGERSRHRSQQRLDKLCELQAKALALIGGEKGEGGK